MAVPFGMIAWAERERLLRASSDHRSAAVWRAGAASSPYWPCARQEETGTMGAGTSLTYVMGDIHGRLDLLTTLLAQIEHHRAGRDRTIVFLGDYIDRGPDSASVVATVRKLQARKTSKQHRCHFGQ